MKRHVLILLLFSFLIFNLNLNFTGTGDNTPARLLPFNLFSGNGFFFDQYEAFLPKENRYVFQKFGNHYISAYPYLPGLLAVPIHLPFFLYLKISNLNSLENLYYYSFIAEKLSASIFAALSVVAFFFLFNRIFQNKKAGFIFTLIFAFATQTFSISSQHLWQHTIANLFLILSLYFLINRRFVYSLLFAVLCLFSRNIYIVYVPLLFLLICLTERHCRKIYTAIALGGITIFVALNYYLYGLLIGTEAVSASNFNLSNVFSNITVLLFSPARGIIFYTPFFVFAFGSMFLVKKILKEERNKKMLLILSLIFIYFILLIYSTYGLVDDGWVWGDRYLTDAAVPAVILSYYFISQYKRRLLTIIFIITIIYSVLTQIIGTFYYPKGRWDNYPASIGESLERLWDFSDNPILRNFAQGPKLDGFYMLYYALAAVDSGKNYNNTACSTEKLSEDSYFGYKRITIKLTNGSDSNWLTAGKFFVQLRQFFTKSGKVVAYSPISATFLPPIVKAHSAVVTNMIIVPPKEDFDTITIAPAQISLNIVTNQEKIVWWNKCQVVINKL